MTPDDRDLDALLADGLVVADVDELAARRMRATAIAELGHARRRGLGRWLESAAVAAMASSYLVWAVSAVLDVYR